MSNASTKQLKRLLAVGDIHGHLDKLISLMDKVKPTSGDRVIFLGDYIDRGPDSKGVLDYLMNFNQFYPEAETVFLRGNHEQMLLDALIEDRLHNEINEGGRRERLRDISTSFADECKIDDDFSRFIDNGGQATLDSYGNGGNIWDILPEHEAFLASCTFWHHEIITIDDSKQLEFIFVHAGMRGGTAVADQDKHDLIWLREPFISIPMDFMGAIVVHGHTPDQEAPVFKNSRIGMDGGVCNPAGRLVCCDLLSRNSWDHL